MHLPHRKQLSAQEDRLLLRPQCHYARWVSQVYKEGGILDLSEGCLSKEEMNAKEILENRDYHAFNVMFPRTNYEGQCCVCGVACRAFLEGEGAIQESSAP